MRASFTGVSAVRRLALAALFGALPATALALPTPDVVVGVVNVVPWVVAGLAAVAAAVHALLGRLLGRRVGDFASGALAGALVVAVVAVAWAASAALSALREREAADLGMYLRCDLAAHDRSDLLKARREDIRSAWWRHVNFEYVSREDLVGRLEQRPDAALIATHSFAIAYHAGIPAVEVKGGLRAFDHVRIADLAEHLEGVAAKDLYMTGTSIFESPVEEWSELAEQLARFERVAEVVGFRPDHRYVRGDDGSLRLVDVRQLLDWPVRRETWILDEGRVRFPNLVDLLDAETVARLLDDEDVLVVAAWDGRWRGTRTYEDDYLDVLLDGVDPHRVLRIDIAAPGFAKRMELHAKRLDGRRHLVVGITKYDWYAGLDHGFALWELLGRDPKRFRYLGGTSLLPEAVALQWVGRRERGGTDLATPPYRWALGRLKEGLGAPAGAAVLVLAALLRLVLAPVGFREAKSRALRTRIAHLADAPDPPAWRGAAAALGRALGVSRAWEAAGAVVTLALLVPIYGILTNPGTLDPGEGLLWVERLGDRDVVLSLVVGALVFLKLAVSASGARLLHAAVALAFTPLLLAIPAAVLVHATGVLGVTAVQDLLARRRAMTALDRALMRA